MRDLVAVSPAPDRIDLFWRDATDAPRTRTWRGDGGWSPEIALGGTLASAAAGGAWTADPSDPTVRDDGGVRLEVFAIHPDGELHDR